MTTFNQTLNLNKDTYVFNNVKTGGTIGIFNYEQLENIDTNIFTDKINTIDNITKPETIFDLNHLFIKKNLIIESKKQYSYIINKGITNVNNDINISDKYKSLDIHFLGNHNNTNNLNIYNQSYYQTFLKNLYINGNKNTNYIHNLISDNDTIIKSNINITNNFSNNNLIYDVIDIKYNITTKNNLNIYNDIVISETKLNNSTIKNISINKSTSCKIFILPKINNNSKNFKNGSIAYNPINNSMFSYLNNKPYYINKKNQNGNTMINQKFPNIDFISNNKNIVNFNYSTSSLSIKSNTTTIKNNLNVYEVLHIKNNDYTTTINDLFYTNNLIFKENSNFIISSNINYNTNVYNSSIRYNNLNKIYEKYNNNKWIPLLDISNLNKTTFLELQSINDSKNINNTIIFNSNKKTIFKLNQSELLFNSYNHYLPQNSTLKKDCFIINNVNCESLYMNNNQSNVRLVNNNNKIYYNNNLIYLSKTSITTSNIYSCYNFYIQSIKNIYKKCDTINSIISSNLFVNNQISLYNYKLYNNIKITNIIIYLNKKCNTSLLLKVSNNNTEYVAPFNILGELKDNVSLDTNIILSSNENLNISIKSHNNIKNLSAKIYIRCKNNDSYGLIYPNNISLFIDRKNVFDLEDRKFYGNFNISNNLNINDNINVNKVTYIKNNLHINSNNNNLLSISNNNNKSIFYIDSNSNSIGFFTKQALKNNNITIDGNISIDKNVTISKQLNIKGSTIVNNNLNINNTLFINNLTSLNNINVSNNLDILNNVTFNNNLNIINNITVTNNVNNDYIIFTDISSNYYSNIKYKNDKLKLYNGSWGDVIEYPNYNNNDNIYLEDNNDIKFKYKTKTILHINQNSVTTNGLNIDNNKILNISPNFYISKDYINVDSSNFYVNNSNILNDLLLLEQHYYTPYNINFSKNMNLSYNISYNMPRLYKNLKTYDTNIAKNIEYISYQLCLGNINSHFHPNWNNNSIIYYKKYLNDDNFINHSFTIPDNTHTYNTNLNFDFITTNNPTYNINIGTQDKLQYIYKTTNQSLDFLNNNNKISMRIIPIYNIKNAIYIYYSQIVNI